MFKKNPDLHGNAPDNSPVALILIDVINDLEFEEGELLLEHALPMAERVSALKRRARDLGIPVIYVNDNFGRWQSNFSKLIEHCREEPVRGKEIVQLLAPDDQDYFVLKPKHSGFYSTSLDVLLQYLGASRLIITGMAGNICVLFTANDAYMRDFYLHVPRDCVASNTAEENEIALKQMEKFLKADLTSSQDLNLEQLLRETGKR